MTITTKELPCELTDEEIADRRAKLTESAIARADIEARIDELKKVAKDHAKIVDTAARELREGTTLRDVRCREVQVFEQNTVELRREDTDEVVDTRAMSAADRQTTIVTEDTSAPKKRIKPKKEAATDEDPPPMTGPDENGEYHPAH